MDGHRDVWTFPCKRQSCSFSSDSDKLKTIMRRDPVRSSWDQLKSRKAGRPVSQSESSVSEQRLTSHHHHSSTEQTSGFTRLGLMWSVWPPADVMLWSTRFLVPLCPMCPSVSSVLGRRPHMWTSCCPCSQRESIMVEMELSGGSYSCSHELYVLMMVLHVERSQWRWFL